MAIWLRTLLGLLVAAPLIAGAWYAVGADPQPPAPREPIVLDTSGPADRDGPQRGLRTPGDSRPGPAIGTDPDEVEVVRPEPDDLDEDPDGGPDASDGDGDGDNGDSDDHEGPGDDDDDGPRDD